MYGKCLPVLLCTLSLAVAHAPPARAGMCGGGNANMLIVLDKSGSMGSSNKWNYAKSAINNLVSGNPQIRFGLLLYPMGSGCPNYGPQVPCGLNNHSAIMSKLNSYSPGGGTPTGGALNAAFNYLKGLPATHSKYVLVITDGCSSTSCGNPVSVVSSMYSTGIKTFVVGFGTGVCTGELSGMAKAGGSGSYYKASVPSSLNAVLNTIAQQVNCCGNGVVDSGETCDTKIPAGSPGACPTSCNDGKVCTKDVMSGTACTLQCVITPITSAINGDGCCPPGATSLTDTDCLVVCGNGILEAGELCDPGISSGFGKCPTITDCDDKNNCTKDVLQGTACLTQCGHTQAAASLAVKDGCCPPGATSLTDADCAVACGNGLLESGESCDPGISSGPGKCPTLADCDDKDSCTTDSVTGGACSLKCLNSAVPANATAKDGCCPKGANAKTDVDCPPGCGNGVMESGELCDTAIKSGPGKCPTAADCDDKDVCTIDGLTGAACMVKCSNTTVAPNKYQKDGCCPKGHSSYTDADCLPPCGPDRTKNCVDPCKGVVCPAGTYCHLGKCVPFPDLGASPSSDANDPNPPDGGVVTPTDSGAVYVNEAGQGYSYNEAGNAYFREFGTNPGTTPPGNGFVTMDGCACSHVGGSGADALPIFFVIGLIFAWSRRRNQTRP